MQAISGEWRPGVYTGELTAHRSLYKPLSLGHSVCKTQHLACAEISLVVPWSSVSGPTWEPFDSVFIRNLSSFNILLIFAWLVCLSNAELGAHFDKSGHFTHYSTSQTTQKNTFPQHQQMSGAIKWQVKESERWSGLHPRTAQLLQRV